MCSVYATDLDVFGLEVLIPARENGFLLPILCKRALKLTQHFCPIRNVAPFPEDNAADYFRLAPR